MTDNSQPVFIEYLVEGPATAAAVARGQTDVFGVVIRPAHGQPQVIPEEDIRQTLQALGPARRVYRDAVFARALEFEKGYPLAGHFDDLKTLQQLLDNKEPWPWLSACCNGMAAIVEHGVQVTLQTRRLYSELMPLLAQTNQASVYQDIELPVIDPTVTMMVTGVPVDREELDRRLNQLDTDLVDSRNQYNAAAGRWVSVDYYGDLCKSLFTELGLPIRWRTRIGSPSVSLVALQELEACYPAVRYLRQYRLVQQMRIAAQDLRVNTDEATWYAHPELDHLGTETGRFTCSRPALQSLPPGLRQLVVAEEGRTFLELDATQCELRILAHLSQDDRLLDAVTNGDVHQRTAAAVLGILEANVTPAQRHFVGKQVNFGIIYGQTELGLARELDVEVGEARNLLATFFGRYPAVAAWINNVHASVEQLGYVETLFGRRRNLPHVWSQDPCEAAQAHRQAVNTIIQGTAADLIKQLLGKLHRALPADCQLHLMVHDSVLMSVSTDQVPAAMEIIEQVIQELAIPMRFTLGMGHTWGECKRNVVPLSLSDDASTEPVVTTTRPPSNTSISGATQES